MGTILIIGACFLILMGFFFYHIFVETAKEVEKKADKDREPMKRDFREFLQEIRFEGEFIFYNEHEISQKNYNLRFSERKDVRIPDLFDLNKIHAFNKSRWRRFKLIDNDWS